MNICELSYQHRKNAPYFFKNLSFELERGKLHGLYGKNGSGKSVLLHLLSDRRPADSIVSGEVKSHGFVRLINQRFDRMIADRFSFDENLRFACMGSHPSLYHSLGGGVEHLDFIDKFHIDRKQPVHRLSGGQRQILALLMILQKPVDILLLDEPTATLDEENAAMVFEFLKVLTTKNVTVLCVCHDRELIGHYVTGQSLNLVKLPCGIRTISIC